MQYEIARKYEDDLFLQTCAIRGVVPSQTEHEEFIKEWSKPLPPLKRDTTHQNSMKMEGTINGVQIVA